MKSFSQRRSQLQEKRLAEEIGGRVQPASGAMDFAKGDVRIAGVVRIECKTTSKASYILKVAELKKIQNEALLGGDDDWAMQIEFQGQAGLNKRVAVIDWYAYEQLRKDASNR